MGLVLYVGWLVVYFGFDGIECVDLFEDSGG